MGLEEMTRSWHHLLLWFTSGDLLPGLVHGAGDYPVLQVLRGDRSYSGQGRTVSSYLDHKLVMT